MRKGKFQLLTGPRGIQVPSHILFVDDIMVFGHCSKSSLQSLMNLFQVDVEASGQVASKNVIFIMGPCLELVLLLFNKCLVFLLGHFFLIS